VVAVTKRGRGRWIDALQRLSGGLVGAAVGMMTEVGLFIIRTTRE
jgi:hypothetical protein